MINFNKLLPFVHQLILGFIDEGDIAVDGTAGNGHDTLILAQAVGVTGKVYAFDIQELAIENTKNRLKLANVLDRVKLINEGHEKISEYCPENIKVAMFNLGYLPGGDHSIITKGNTTLMAIEASLNKLHPKGIISIVVYSGHEGGEQEKNIVEEYLKGLDITEWRVITWKQINGSTTAPYLLLISPQNNRGRE